MKNFNFKDFIIGIVALIAYFLLSNLQNFPFILAGIDTNNISTNIKIIYLVIYEIMTIAIILLIFNKQIKKSFKDILINHKKYFSENMKYYLIGIFVMLLSNSFIVFVLENNIASNEEAIRSLFQISPLYIYFSSVIYAPIVEELTFRQAFKNILGRNWIFILVSGLVFGGLHVIDSGISLIDMLYLIPYSSLGIAFAYILYKTDNIFVTIGFHFMHNGILIALQFLTLLF